MEQAISDTQAHVVTPPPPTGIRAFYKHIRDWLEAYFWLPISLFCVYLSAKFAFLLTGRKPTENADWIVELSFRTIAIIILIFLLSIRKEQSSFWMKKEEAFANPQVYRTQTWAGIAYAAIFGYILIH